MSTRTSVEPFAKVSIGKQTERRTQRQGGQRDGTFYSFLLLLLLLQFFELPCCLHFVPFLALPPLLGLCPFVFVLERGGRTTGHENNRKGIRNQERLPHGGGASFYSSSIPIRFGFP